MTLVCQLSLTSLMKLLRACEEYFIMLRAVNKLYHFLFIPVRQMQHDSTIKVSKRIFRATSSMQGGLEAISKRSCTLQLGAARSLGREAGGLVRTSRPSGL